MLGNILEDAPAAPAGGNVNLDVRDTIDRVVVYGIIPERGGLDNPASTSTPTFTISTLNTASVSGGAP